jgi:uncharacterized protein YkwD
MTRRATAAVAALCALLLASCGGEASEPAATGRSGLGTPLAATNDGAGGVVSPGAQSTPSTGVVEGGPDQAPLEEIAPPDEEALADGAGSCGAVDAEPSRATLGETGQAILCLLNVERTSRGRGRLRMNARLSRAARGHSRDMVRNTYFAHDAKNGASMLDRIRAAGYLRPRTRWTVGENIAWGSGPLASPRALVRAWMNSPPHRANILQARFRELGVGLVLGAPSPGVSGIALTATTNFGRVSRGRRR